MCLCLCEGTSVFLASNCLTIMMLRFLVECVLLYINTDSQSLGNVVLMQRTNSAYVYTYHTWEYILEE